MIRKIFTYAAFWLFCISGKAQTTFPEAGKWYALKIEKDGVYEINKRFFEDFGISAAELDPDYIRLFATDVKQLPQANETSGDIVLHEIPVWTNNVNERFDKTDFIRFFAEGPDEIITNSAGYFSHHIHAYDRYNTVFVQIGASQKSKRVAAAKVPNGQKKTLTDLFHYEYYEPEIANLLDSGREWLGEYFFSEWKKRFETKGFVLNSQAHLSLKMVGQTYEDAHLDVLYKGSVIGGTDFDKITYRWNDNFRRYDRAGEISTVGMEFTITEDSPEFTFRLPADLDISSGVRLDYLELSGRRKIAAYGEQHSGYLLEDGAFEFDAGSLGQVWNCSDVFEPLSLTIENGKFAFETVNRPCRLLFFDDQNLLSPIDLKEVSPIRFDVLDVPDLLIVYPKLFEKEIEKLADFRRNHDGLTVLTMERDRLFDHFSGGKNDPTAIRNLCRFLWDKEPGKLKYLLLFGDTTFDPKNNNGLPFVKPEAYLPTYESRESLEPIFSYSSDDYFGFLEKNEGEWPEGYSINGRWVSNQANDHTLDIAVGRLPVKSRNEANLLVDKIIHYGSSKSMTGNWKRRVAFIADDGDRNTHQMDGEAFSEILEEENKAAQAFKIYVDAFPQLKTELGERVPEANEHFEDELKKGVLVVNYNGHGSEDGWTDEKLLTIGQIQHWRNFDRLPVFLTATCEFGRFDNPSVVSGAELALLNPDGGAIALLTTTRPVFSSTNYPINAAFYTHLFEEAEKGIRLGDVFRKTKNDAILGEVNRNFSLLGDPSMLIGYPNYELRVTSVNEQHADSARVKYGSKVRLKGELTNATFSGKIQVSVFDKKIEKSTLGTDGNVIMPYKEVTNKLFDGISELQTGQFSVDFTLPQRQDSSTGVLHIYLYAVNTDSTVEAIGGHHTLEVSGLENEQITDDSPPTASLVYEADSGNLLIGLTDDSGINTSSLDSDQNIVLILNDTLEIILNDYYVADHTGSSGTISFPIGQLSAGMHTIGLKVSDVYTNRSSYTFEITVDPRPFKVELLSLLPNPTDGLLNAEITQNAIGENVKVELRILDQTGRIVSTEVKECFQCENKVRIGMNLESYLTVSGRYIYNIRAIVEKAKAESSVSGHLLFWK